VALILTAYDTGLRIHAIMSLTRKNFDFELCAVLANWDSQKQNADQWIGLKRRTADALRAIETESPKLFAWPHDIVAKADRIPTYKTLRRHFIRDVLTPAGLPGDDKPFHRFRRTSNTQIKKAGGEAQAQLGHSSPAVSALYDDVEELGPMRGCDRIPDIIVPKIEKQLELF
jgi:integrase